MKLQNVLLPKVGICTVENMFFRREAAHEREIEFNVEEQTLTFEKQGRCWFDTYFNGLSVEKWKKYTTIGDIKLNLYLKGKFEVTLTNLERFEHRVSVKMVESKIVEAEEKTLFTFNYKLYEFKGMLSFYLKSLEDDSVYYGGWYDGEVKQEELVETNIAINICTFKREPFVKRNIDILRKNIIENRENPLSGHLRVYISDNGQTLDLGKLNNKDVRIVYNKNVGGAGGFSRGLLEIMKHKDEFPATHALMMDDDIIIEPEALYRTYVLLCCRKEQYKDMFIGGAMLRLDEQNIQVESGASWNAGNLISNKSGLNVSDLEACLYNEIEEYTEFNAWWYCCTPMDLVNTENLPYPIFIRGDDLEFGLRNMKTLVLMNGICVWHEAFENKYSSFLSYYILRNMLYDNAMHFTNYKMTEFLRRLYRNVIHELFLYRYKNVELIYRGVRDYFKGVPFLLETDGEKLHKDIMASGYKPVPIEQLEDVAMHLSVYYDSLREGETKWQNRIRRCSLNGYLLPARKDYGKNIQVVSMSGCRPLNCYRRAKVLNYDPASGKGFVTKKDTGKAFLLLLELIGLTFKTVMNFSNARERFRKESAAIRNKDFWNKYLGEK